MMTSHILRSADFTKSQKPRYLENETLFFLQINKIHSLHMKGYFIAKNNFVAEVTFKKYIQKCTLSYVLILIMMSQIW